MGTHYLELELICPPDGTAVGKGLLVRTVRVEEMCAKKY